MTKEEALKLALEALEDLGMKHFESTGEVLYKDTFTAIKEALANEALEKKAENARELGLDYEPDPVAWEQFYPDMGNPKLAYLSPTESPDNACYIPPQRPSRSDIKPLTDEEIEDIWVECPADWDDKINVLTLARAIEAAHGIKE